MVVSIHQPDYVPYLGYFYKVHKSDVFVFLDNVQFSSSNMHHWNTVQSNGKTVRLKIPVEYSFGDKLTQVRCKNELGWREKHLKILEDNYSNAPFFSTVFPEIREKLYEDYNSLAELNIKMNTFIIEKMGMKAKIVLASDIETNGKKEELVIDICRSLGGDTYISGNGAKDYQDEEHFNQNGIKLVYTDFEPTPYNQNSENFVENMSVIDYLMNCGWSNPFLTK